MRDETLEIILDILFQMKEEVARGPAVDVEKAYGATLILLIVSDLAYKFNLSRDETLERFTQGLR